ncbi:MAG: T9SS type A sorting domain-containing protein, partial [Pyrinomonadaceae bacterium]|nr:T9SS type A sorting domain-containing protein [Sphingobacteriaceae bacterium]
TNISSGLPYIQTGQGFYVKAKPGGGTITFTESCKSVLASPDRLLGKPSEEIFQSATFLSSEINSKKAGNFIRLELSNSKNTDEAIIVFTEGANAAYSTGDAVYFTGSTVSLSSLTTDMQNVAINFMPAVDQITEVKLKADAAVSGKVKLKFTDIHLPKDFEVFLEDDYLHTLTNVRSHCVYEFIIDKANPATFGSARFSIIIKDNSPVLMVNEMNVYPNPVNNILNVTVPAGNIKDVKWTVYDVMGNKWLSGAGVKPDVGDLPAGLYLIKFIDTRNNRVVGRSKFLKE